jgi:hypothetical protein
MYAGTFEFAGQRLRVLTSGKRIYIEGPGEPKLRILPVAEDKFLLESLGAVIVFEKTGDKIERMLFLIGDKQISAKRVDETAPAPAPAPAP